MQDEVKAKFRAFQEEAERSRRDKERYIQVLWRAMEVHGIASPFSNAASIGLARAERELHGKLCLVSGAPGDGPRVLKQADFPAVAEAVGLPSFRAIPSLESWIIILVSYLLSIFMVRVSRF